MRNLSPKPTDSELKGMYVMNHHTQKNIGDGSIFKIDGKKYKLQKVSPKSKFSNILVIRYFTISFIWSHPSCFVTILFMLENKKKDLHIINK